MYPVNLFLATRAIKARTLPLPDLFDICTTFPARLPGPAINPILLLEISGIAVAANEIAQAAAACFYRAPEGFLDCLRQSRASSRSNPAGSVGGINTGKKERFVCVNVSDADDNAAVHQYLFNAGATVSGFAIKQLAVERFGKGFGSQVRQQGVIGGISRSPQHSPKATGIPKTENHAVIQEQIDMIVLLWSDISCKGQQSQAAGHAEMQDQRASTAVEQEVFSATRYRSDFQAAKRSLKFRHRPA